jgi:hypothetical protein
VQTLTGWRNWLAANNNGVMIVVLLIMGVKLVGAGLGGPIG